MRMLWRLAQWIFWGFYKLSIAIEKKKGMPSSTTIHEPSLKSAFPPGEEWKMRAESHTYHPGDGWPGYDGPRPDDRSLWLSHWKGGPDEHLKDHVPPKGMSSSTTAFPPGEEWKLLSVKPYTYHPGDGWPGYDGPRPDDRSLWLSHWKGGPDEHLKDHVPPNVQKSSSMALSFDDAPKTGPSLEEGEQNSEEYKQVLGRENDTEKLTLQYGENAHIDVKENIFVVIDWKQHIVDLVFQAFAFLLTPSGKVRGDDDIVFFNNIHSKDRVVELVYEPLIVKRNDAKVFSVQLSNIPDSIERISIAATIHETGSRMKTFGDLQEASIFLVDQKTKQEFICFDLPISSSKAVSMIFGEIYRHNSRWKFRAIGQGFNSGLSEMAGKFGVDITHGDIEQTYHKTNKSTAEEINVTGQQGYVYILANSSMPGLVKVGKTKRSPSDRANELSSTTGLPTPFIVVYEQLFIDCDNAEKYIHTVLSNKGHRTAKNREFFNAKTSEIIKIITKTPGLILEQKDSSLLVIDDDRESDSTNLWYSTYSEAINYLVGNNCLQDFYEAMKLFNDAVNLGCLKAYGRIGQMYFHGQGVAKSRKNALKYYKDGVNKGDYYCYLNMRELFRHDQDINIDNINKCSVYFFKARKSNFNQDAEYGENYINSCLDLLIGQNRPDKEIMHNFFKIKKELLSECVRNIETISSGVLDSTYDGELRESLLYSYKACTWYIKTFP